MRVDASMGTCTLPASVNTPAAPLYVERPGGMVAKAAYVKTAKAGIRAHPCAPMYPYGGIGGYATPNRVEIHTDNQLRRWYGKPAPMRRMRPYGRMRFYV